MTETLAQVPFTVTAGLQRHAHYAELAVSAPVHRIMLPTGEPAWLITDYDEVRRALHDPRLVKGLVAAANTACDLVPPAVFAAMASHMLNCNPESSRSLTSCSTRWTPKLRPI